MKYQRYSNQTSDLHSLMNQSSSKLLATLNNDLNNLPANNNPLKPRPFLKESVVNNTTFTDFDRFQARLSPTASKSDFNKFLDKITQEKTMYDSNMSGNL